MEFEDVSEKKDQDAWRLKAVAEKIEWEARRVAAAFGVQEWMTVRWPEVMVSSGTTSTHDPIRLTTDYNFHRFWLEVGEDGEDCDVVRIEGGQSLGGSLLSVSNPCDCYQELMARALYCLDLRIYDLDFSTSTPLSNLVGMLTESEKIELRLSMPREFWPQKWLDEQGQ